MVERGAIVIKGGDRLDERRWRKWERFENGLRTAFGQEPRIPSWGKTSFLDVNFPGNVDGQGRTSLSVVDRNLSLPPSPSLLLRLFKKSTKFDSEFFSHNGRSDLAAFSFFSMKISLLPSPHCLPHAFKIPRLQGGPLCRSP